MLTELCVLPVVDRLTVRWTWYTIAQWHTFGCWLDGVYRLVRWRRRTENFTVVWFHPTKLAQLPWPRRVDDRHKEEETAKRDLEMHDGLAVFLGELACCIQTTIITSLSKVIWEEGRESKSPLFAMARPKFASKSTPSREPIDKLHCLPHPRTVRPMMPNGIRIRFAVFPQCTGQTDAPTDR